MKPLNVILGVLVLAAATLAVPALLASIVAGAAGFLMLATAGPMPVLFPWFKRCKLFARSKSPGFQCFRVGRRYGRCRVSPGQRKTGEPLLSCPGVMP